MTFNESEDLFRTRKTLSLILLPYSGFCIFFRFLYAYMFFFFGSCTLKRSIENGIPTSDTMTSRDVKCIFVTLNHYTINRRRSALKKV